VADERHGDVKLTKITVFMRIHHVRQCVREPSYPCSVVSGDRYRIDSVSHFLDAKHSAHRTESEISGARWRTLIAIEANKVAEVEPKVNFMPFLLVDVFWVAEIAEGVSLHV
jgi:hypothetical protein